MGQFQMNDCVFTRESKPGTTTAQDDENRKTWKRVAFVKKISVMVKLQPSTLLRI